MSAQSMMTNTNKYFCFFHISLTPNWYWFECCNEQSTKSFVWKIRRNVLVWMCWPKVHKNWYNQNVWVSAACRSRISISFTRIIASLIVWTRIRISNKEVERKEVESGDGWRMLCGKIWDCVTGVFVLGKLPRSSRVKFASHYSLCVINVL